MKLCDDCRDNPEFWPDGEDQMCTWCYAQWAQERIEYLETEISRLLLDLAEQENKEGHL